MAEFIMSMDPSWVPLIEGGLKTSTIRTRRKCDPGDAFELNGRRYIVTSVESMGLKEAAERHWSSEGFQGPEDVRRTLLSYYPDLDDDSVVWVHCFSEVPP